MPMKACPQLFKIIKNDTDISAYRGFCKNKYSVKCLACYIYWLYKAFLNTDVQVVTYNTIAQARKCPQSPKNTYKWTVPNHIFKCSIFVIFYCKCTSKSLFCVCVCMCVWRGGGDKGEREVLPKHNELKIQRRWPCSFDIHPESTTQTHTHTHLQFCFVNHMLSKCLFFSWAGNSGSGKSWREKSMTEKICCWEVVHKDTNLHV